MVKNGTAQIKHGGDDNASTMVLLPIKELY